MNGMNSYRDPNFWKLSMQLAKDTHSITRMLRSLIRASQSKKKSS